jgi:hypothetical protein
LTKKLWFYILLFLGTDQMRYIYPRAEVAQSVEQGTENPRVGGSIPSLGTMIKEGLVNQDQTLLLFFFIISIAETVPRLLVSA